MNRAITVRVPLSSEQLYEGFGQLGARLRELQDTYIVVQCDPAQSMSKCHFEQA